jgi:hypothetical protein
MWITELAMNTTTADSSIGSQSEMRLTTALPFPAYLLVTSLSIEPGGLAAL